MFRLTPGMSPSNLHYTYSRHVSYMERKPFILLHLQFTSFVFLLVLFHSDTTYYLQLNFLTHDLSPLFHCCNIYNLQPLSHAYRLFAYFTHFSLTTLTIYTLYLSTTVYLPILANFSVYIKILSDTNTAFYSDAEMRITCFHKCRSRLVHSNNS